MKIKSIDLISILLGFTAWIFFDISLQIKILTTFLFIVLIVIARLKQEIFTEVELLNIAIGEFAWLLPDIDTALKITICLALIGITVIYHQTKTLYKKPSEKQYLILLGINIGIAYVEFLLATIPLDRESVPNGAQIAIASVIFTIIIGLPIELFGAFVTESLMNVIVGCLYQGVISLLSIVLFSGVYVNLSLINNDVQRTFSDISFLATAGPAGLLLSANTAGTVIGTIAAPLIVLQYILIGMLAKGKTETWLQR